MNMGQNRYMSDELWSKRTILTLKGSRPKDKRKIQHHPLSHGFTLLSSSETKREMT